jgi:hypothetical protein
MKKIYLVYISVLCTILNINYVFADGEWGENVKNWITREVGFLALGVVILIMIPMLLKKAWAALAGTLFASGIALFFINKPEALKAIGEILSKIIFGDDVNV